MLDSEPMMYSRARETSITNNIKEETTNGHTNVLSHKKKDTDKNTLSSCTH